MVNIFVRVNDGGWIHALTIPPNDIQRLSLRPLKWLRFAAFAAFGAKGHLLDAPGGNIVNDETEHAGLGENYFFQHDGPQHIVDNRGLDGLTESQSTQGPRTRRRASFRRRIAQRDGNRCVITLDTADACQAAHIIPHAKGNAV